MRLATILIALVGMAIFTAVFAGSQTDVDFPVLDTPNVTFRAMPSDCSGFDDALYCIGLGVINVVLGVIFVVLGLVNGAIFLGEILVLATTLAVAGFIGAPWYVNTGIAAFFTIQLGIIIFRMTRSGDDDA